MEEVITEPYVTIKMDQGNLSLLSDWIGSPTTEQFREGKSKILDVLIDHSLSVMVLNYHNMVAYINLETQVWAINEWFPKVISENIKRVGIVIPNKVMAQIVVKSIYMGLSGAAAKHGIEINYFDNLAQLQAWISGVGASNPSAAMGSSQIIKREMRPSINQPASPPAPKTTYSGVDLGGSKQPSAPDYSSMDDEIHDDPFA